MDLSLSSLTCEFGILQMMRNTRNPVWNEEFQFLLEEPPLQEKIHINVMSKRTGISFKSKVIIRLIKLQQLPFVQFEMNF